MKRILALLALMALLLSFGGCSLLQEKSVDEPVVDTSGDERDVQYYKDTATGLIAAGDYDGAAAVLQEGISRTNDWELVQMLNDISNLVSNPSGNNETAPPATTPASAPVQTEASSQKVMLSSVQKRINVFLSNFAEAFFYNYPCDKHQMLRFAKIHAMLNQDGDIHYISDECYISQETVNSILNKYFGITYSENGSPDSYTNSYGETIRYDGKNYYYVAGAGEFYGYLTIANDMYRNSDGTYTVTYDVYSLANMWDDETGNYYSYSASQGRTSSALEYCYSGEAVVKDYTRTNGVQSYQLIRMKRYKI